MKINSLGLATSHRSSKNISVAKRRRLKLRNPRQDVCTFLTELPLYARSGHEGVGRTLRRASYSKSGSHPSRATSRSLSNPNMTDFQA